MIIKKLLQPTVFILLTLMIILVDAAVFLYTSLLVTAFILVKILPGAKFGGGEGALTIGALSMVIGLLVTPLSLIPSYKLSLKLADYLRERRIVNIKEPKKMFFLALFIPFLLIILLGILGTIL